MFVCAFLKVPRRRSARRSCLRQCWTPNLRHSRTVTHKRHAFIFSPLLIFAKRISALGTKLTTQVLYPYSEVQPLHCVFPPLSTFFLFTDAVIVDTESYIKRGPNVSSCLMQDKLKTSTNSPPLTSAKKVHKSLLYLSNEANVTSICNFN